MDEFNKPLKRNKYKSFSDNITLYIGIILLLVAGYFCFTGYETSEDATVEGRMVTVASRVEGDVVNVFIEDGQEVRKGDLLLEIDPNVYQLKLREAEAELNNAKVKLLLSEKPDREDPIVIEDGKTSKSLIDAKYGFAKNDLDKLARMFSGNVQKRKDATSLKNIKMDEKKDQARQAMQEQQAQNNQTVQNLPKLDEEEEEYDMIDTVELRAKIKTLEAKVADCKLNLSYTKVYANQDGIISSRNVKVGDHVTVGQELFNLVPRRVWVVANYTSEQTQNMHEGQNVYIKSADYPRRFFKGMIENVEDFDEIVRVNKEKTEPETSDIVPVKIVFVKDYSEYSFVPGMKVSTAVKTR